MTSQYANLVWLEDENGTRYVCHLNDDERKGVHTYNQLSDEEKTHCDSEVEFPFN